MRSSVASLPLLVLLALLPWASACDDPVQPVEEEPLASGFRVSVEGAVRVSASGAASSGTLSVPVGQELLLEVEFLDGSGGAVSPGAGLSLDAEAHVPGVASLQVVSGSEFTARLQGTAQGTTTARFTLLENGRPQYISPPVEVRVGP